MVIFLLAFVRFFSGTLETSGQLRARNELLMEAQTAQGLMVNRIKEAWYVFPPGTSITLSSSGWTTARVLNYTDPPAYTWKTGDHFLAMILPPEKEGVPCSKDNKGCFRFFAYYPMNRAYYNEKAGVAEKLNPDANETKTWVLMEYRAYYPASRCPVTASGDPDPTNTAYRGKRAYFLVDYVQPLKDPRDSRYDYPKLFDYKTASGKVNYVLTELRFWRVLTPGNYEIRVPPEPGSTLRLGASPYNLSAKASRSDYYCR